MGSLSRNWFQLSTKRTQAGVSCSEEGVFVGDVPLLERICVEGGKGRWRPRPLSDLNDELAKRYELPVAFAPKIAALEAIANMLDRNDVTLAQIATLNLQIPDPPHPTKPARSARDAIELAGRLHVSGLLKFDWDESEHPRWPEGAPDSQGGQFAPKNENSDAQSSSGSSATDRDISFATDTPPAGDNSERPQSAVYYEAENHGSDPNLIPVGEISPFTANHRHQPEQTLIWSEPKHAASHEPDATPGDIREAIQHQFASKKGGEYWIDPKTYQFDSAIDIAQQIDDSINEPTGYMHGLANEAAKAGRTVSFNTHDWHPGTQAMRFQNPIWAGDTVGRVAGRIQDGQLSVGTDGSYTATGTVELEHTGLYDWAADGEDKLKNAVIETVGNMPYVIDGRVQSYKDGVPVALHFNRNVKFIVRGRYRPIQSY